MDSELRQRIVFDRATANAQRRYRDALRERMSGPESDYFASLRFVVFPATETLIRQHYPFTQEGIGDPPNRPPNYSYQEFTGEARAFAKFEEACSRMNGEAVLGIGPITGIVFKESTFVVPAAPLLLVDCEKAAEHLKNWWMLGRGMVSLVRPNARAGAAVDTYWGHPPDPLVGLVYQIAAWGLEQHS